VLAVKVVLNFVKAKTFTVVMSADLFLQLLISLQMYAVLRPKITQECDQRMLSGLLLEQTPEEAKALLDEFDEDRDGHFDDGEIKAMMGKVHQKTIDNLDSYENKAKAVLNKAKKKRDERSTGEKQSDLAIGFAALAGGLSPDEA
jgi:hypothetical protein